MVPNHDLWFCSKLLRNVGFWPNKGGEGFVSYSSLNVVLKFLICVHRYKHSRLISFVCKEETFLYTRTNTMKNYWFRDEGVSEYRSFIIFFFSSRCL